MAATVFRIVRSFAREEKGVVLVLFLLLVVPLLLVIAVGIDFGQTLVVKRQLSGAVDAAALAIAKLPSLTDSELNDKTEAFLKAYYPDTQFGTLTGFTVARGGANNSQIDISATAEISTTFMKLGGVDKLTVVVNSQATSQQKNLEVVMVMDNSGSMATGGKLQAMKSAANTLVDTLFGSDTTSDRVKIGLVPFGGGVNPNVPNTTWWLDKLHKAPLNALYFNNGVSGFDVLSVLSGGILNRWGGCVLSREDGFDTQDTPPDTSNPRTLFSAYVNPFRGANLLSYVGILSNSQNENCPVAPIQPLTNVKSTITSAISAMTASTSTNIPEAIAWGWRVVSPGEPFTEGAAYSDPETIKAVIVLTDGQNDINGSFSSYGKGAGTNTRLGSNWNGTLDTKTAQVCANVKADKDGAANDEDIIVYTLTFGNLPASAETLMQNCASGTNRYFHAPTSADLQAAFESIAAGLGQLRLTQ